MEAIFSALAEPTRRALLSRLQVDGALSVSELSQPLAMSRQAVTKHLDVLCRASLVVVEWHGRERRHRITPEPLELVEEWLEPFAAAWDRRLERLQNHLKENP